MIAMEPQFPKPNILLELETVMPGMSQPNILHFESDEDENVSSDSDESSAGFSSVNNSSNSDLHLLSEKTNSDLHLLSETTNSDQE